jgi:hypothetical protein
MEIAEFATTYPIRRQSLNSIDPLESNSFHQIVMAVTPSSFVARTAVMDMSTRSVSFIKEVQLPGGLLAIRLFGYSRPTALQYKRL